MARINYKEVENYEQSGSEWLRLQNNGDVARVQFMLNSINDLDIFGCHTIDVDGKQRYVDCKREYDSPVNECPLCREGFGLKPVMMLSMYDLEEKKVKIWERGKTFRKKLESLANRYPDLSKMVFEIERVGAKGDKKTTYEVYPIPEQTPVDLSTIEKPNFVGGFILDMTTEQMEDYLRTGSVPSKNDSSNDDEQVLRRRRG